MDKIITTEVFRIGAGQAVRLPKGFEFDANEVCIKRIGAAVLLFPKDVAWNLMADAIRQFDADFMADRNQPAKPDKRKKFT